MPCCHRVFVAPIVLLRSVTPLYKHVHLYQGLLCIVLLAWFGCLFCQTLSSVKSFSSADMRDASMEKGCAHVYHIAPWELPAVCKFAFKLSGT